ncbi:uncharacterized protein LOC122544087 isoform X2 [Chiloscyllium plagiosum]|uniref:uncharacterized protein LOC122544087 isoform X2 n=1 Tax=Chiloscyllium plagiosum TaxID=36176 RepID=UPI001CB7C842|nr:uncharacterized protein LOC122544087 isoform X2 [Chiloscyllium plagiosum]
MESDISAFLWFMFAVSSCIATETDIGISNNEKGPEATAGKGEVNIILMLVIIASYIPTAIRSEEHYYSKQKGHHRIASEEDPLQYPLQTNDVKAIKAMKWIMGASLYLTIAALLCLGTEIDFATSNNEKGQDATVGKGDVNIICLIIIIVNFMLVEICHYSKQTRNHRNYCEEMPFQQSWQRHEAEASEVSTQASWCDSTADIKDIPNASDASTQTSWRDSTADRRDRSNAFDVSTQTSWSVSTADRKDILKVFTVSTQTPWNDSAADIKDIPNMSIQTSLSNSTADIEYIRQGIELRHKDHLQKLTKRLKFTLVTGNQFASDCPLDEN